MKVPTMILCVVTALAMTGSVAHSRKGGTGGGGGGGGGEVDPDPCDGECILWGLREYECGSTPTGVLMCYEPVCLLREDNCGPPAIW